MRTKGILIVMLATLLCACGGGGSGGSSSSSSGNSGSTSPGGGSASFSVWVTSGLGNGVTQVTGAAISAGSCTSTTCITFTGGGMVSTGPVAVDSSGNVWVANVPPGGTNPPYSITEITASAVSAGACSSSTCINFTGDGIYFPQSIATDSQGDAWVADSCASTGCSYGNGGVTEIKPGASQNCSSGCAYFTISPDSNGNPQLLPQGVTVDTAGDVWFSNDGCVVAATCTPNNGSVVEITATAVQSGSCAGGCTLYSNGNIASPRGVAVDSAGNTWVANGCGPANCFDYFGGSVTEIKAGAAVDCSSGCVNYTGGGVFQASGMAIDSSGNIWVADPTLPGLTEITAAAAAAESCSTTSCVNFNTGENTGSIALDPNGGVWLASSLNSTILGIAAGAPADCSSGCTQIALPTTAVDIAVMNH